MIDYDLRAMSNRVLYQVTLASGRILTSPESFGEGESSPPESYFGPVFTQDGRLLTVEAEAMRKAAELQATEA